MQALIAARRALVEERYADAEQNFRVCIDALDAIGADVARTFALRYAARLAGRHGDNARRIITIDNALNLARELGLWGLANALTTDLGHAFFALGDVERARQTFQYSLTEARAAGSLPGIGEALTSLALLEWRAGDAERAAHLAREALEIAFELNDQEIVANCLAVLGSAAASRGELEEADAIHGRALELASDADAPLRTALALEGLASTALFRDDGRRAARLLGAAATLRRVGRHTRGRDFVADAAVDVEALLDRAAASAGAEGATRAFAEGAADPGAVAAAMRASAR
jgi:tetratricopeptide (TPR) repeat protein